MELVMSIVLVICIDAVKVSQCLTQNWESQVAIWWVLLLGITVLVELYYGISG
jgi:hypothetical protein